MNLNVPVLSPLSQTYILHTSDSAFSLIFEMRTSLTWDQSLLTDFRLVSRIIWCS